MINPAMQQSIQQTMNQPSNQANMNNFAMNRNPEFLAQQRARGKTTHSQLYYFSVLTTNRRQIGGKVSGLPKEQFLSTISITSEYGQKLKETHGASSNFLYIFLPQYIFMENFNVFFLIQQRNLHQTLR